jgi:hypothetical protein
VRIIVGTHKIRLKKKEFCYQLSFYVFFHLKQLKKINEQEIKLKLNSIYFYFVIFNVLKQVGLTFPNFSTFVSHSWYRIGLE